MMKNYHKRSVSFGFGITALFFSAWISRAEGHFDQDNGQALVKPSTPVIAPPARRITGSLFNPSATSFTEDPRASKVGDVITILIQESATASSSANTKSSRDDSANFGGGTGLLKGLLKDFGVSSKNSSNGAGSTDRTGALTAKITVTVKEVLPNGLLSVEGTRSIQVNKDTQKVTLTGLVRQIDVAPDNTISSISLANASITYDGKGTVGDHQKKGLISRLFGWL